MTPDTILTAAGPVANPALGQASGAGLGLLLAVNFPAACKAICYVVLGPTPPEAWGGGPDGNFEDRGFGAGFGPDPGCLRF